MANHWLKDEVDLSSVDADRIFEAIWKKLAQTVNKSMSSLSVLSHIHRILKLLQQHQAFADYKYNLLWKGACRVMQVNIQKDDEWICSEKTL